MRTSDLFDVERRLEKRMDREDAVLLGLIAQLEDRLRVLETAPPAPTSARPEDPQVVLRAVVAEQLHGLLDIRDLLDQGTTPAKIRELALKIHSSLHNALLNALP